MAIERERKFLVVGDGWRAAAGEGQTIRQGYLCHGGVAVVRVRMTGASAHLTIKNDAASERRLEFEYEIPTGDAAELLESLTEAGQIHKTRFEVSFPGNRWTIDEFHGRHAGLVLAEIELPEDAEAPPIPAWAGEEVTGNPAYYNATLAAFTEGRRR